MSRRRYEDDDGRTVADMSDLSYQTPFGFYGRSKKEPDPAEPQEKKSRAWEESGLSPAMRRSFTLGALCSALLIALAFIAGLGIVIALLVLAFS